MKARKRIFFSCASIGRSFGARNHRSPRVAILLKSHVRIGDWDRRHEAGDCKAPSQDAERNSGRRFVRPLFTKPLEQVLTKALPPPPTHRVSFLLVWVPLQTLHIDERYERRYFTHPSKVIRGLVRVQVEGGEHTGIMPTVVFPVAKHNIDELAGYIQHGSRLSSFSKRTS